MRVWNSYLIRRRRELLSNSNYPYLHFHCVSTLFLSFFLLHLTLLDSRIETFGKKIFTLSMFFFVFFSFDENFFPHDLSSRKAARKRTNLTSKDIHEGNWEKFDDCYACYYSEIFNCANQMEYI